MESAFTVGDQVVHRWLGAAIYAGDDHMYREDVHIMFADEPDAPLRVSRDRVQPWSDLPALLADFIRINDGDNTMPSNDLGRRIATFIGFRINVMASGEVKRQMQHRRLAAIDFINQINGDKQLGAGALADRVIAKFELGAA